MLCYVRDLMSRPEFDAAMHIDVMGLMKAHGARVWLSSCPHASRYSVHDSSRHDTRGRPLA